MPSSNVGRLRRCLTRKLRAQESSGKHRDFEIFDDDGNLVATTSLSHAWRQSTQISDQMANAIKNELNLQRARELTDLVDCTFTRADYLQMVTRD